MKPMAIKEVRECFTEQLMYGDKFAAENLTYVGGNVMFYEKLIVSRSKNINLRFWNKGLLNGHRDFKFNGSASEKVYLTEDNISNFMHVFNEYHKIYDVLEEIADFRSLAMLHKHDDLMLKFKSDVAKQRKSLANLDTYLLELMLYNIKNGINYNTVVI